MQRHITTFILCLATLFIVAQDKSSAIYIDKNGVMRWTNTRREASFFGVNYTVPFAHAYRAVGYLDKNRKEAIDKDVYHFARLGFNAYRIHIWDVEISDINGNLIENDHLDLLDYLISKLKERDIKIVLTAMTNFGNGYPERNRQTGAFSYAYDKCDIHDNPEAVKAQEEYVRQLAKHVNPYTGKAYMDDPDIVGFEINNEPCHAGTPEQTQKYINGMVTAFKIAGNRKPIFYNVSHNMQQIEAYYSAAIQGTTYQWYPIGLVAGRTRQGNFLPYIDEYHIPFARHTKGFDNKTKLVYEYDPADITYSYMHPAMARTFRTAGFQWITQFAYDSMDMAPFNTEYQTHFLNLAYTPQKAISMKIAAEVAYSVPRNQSYEKYPNDTIFGDFRVSYSQDKSEMNRADKFLHSNHTNTIPVKAEKLQSIAGYGNSPVIKYEGTGAYFMDKLEEGLWRLEIMPDAVQINDPFAKPALTKEVVTIMWGDWAMELSLPDLGKEFTVTGINDGNDFRTKTSDGVLPSIRPGVYLVQRNNLTPVAHRKKDSRWKNIRLNEFVAPQAHAASYSAVHQPEKIIEGGKPLVIEARIAGPERPDSVIIYTDKISFWRDRNSYIKMKRTHDYTYRATIPAEQIEPGKLRYNIVVSGAGKQFTFPDGTAGTPLEWDYTSGKHWESTIVSPESAIQLFTVTDEYSDMESYTMPEWSRTKRELVHNLPPESQTLRFTFESKDATPRFFLHTYIKEKVKNRTSRLNGVKDIHIHLKNAPDSLYIGFITGTGYTYTAPITTKNGIARVPLSQLQQTATALLPHPYPTFLNKYFYPDTSLPFRITDIEKLELSFNGVKETETEIEIGGIWLE